MFAVVFRSFFFVGVILCYSSGLWSLINGYFGKEFKIYLQQHEGAKIGKPEPTYEPFVKPSISNTQISKFSLNAASEGNQYRVSVSDTIPTQKLDYVNPRSALREEPSSSSSLGENPIDWWSHFWITNPKITGENGIHYKTCPILQKLNKDNC